MSKVSIIIPLYNAVNYILETLDSCFSQSYQNFEVIVVENGSTDGSWNIINTIEDERLKCFQTSKANAAAARNFGFKQAGGEYIMFLDADDLISKYKIELQINKLLNSPEDYVASCAWGKFTNSKREASFEEQDVWRVENPVEWCSSSWRGNGMMIPGCWLIPKNIILKSGLWNENLTLNDDGEFMCRVLLASNGNIFVDDALVYYRQVQGSLSRNNTTYKSAKSALETYISYESNILRFSNSQITKNSLATNYFDFIYRYYPYYNDLLSDAFSRINKLGFLNKPHVGGRIFQVLHKSLGFHMALKLKYYFSTVKSILLTSR